MTSPSVSTKGPIRSTDPDVIAVFKRLDVFFLRFADLEKASGYSRHTLGNWRSGYFSPPLADFRNLAQLANYTIELKDTE